MRESRQLFFFWAWDISCRIMHFKSICFPVNFIILYSWIVFHWIQGKKKSCSLLMGVQVNTVVAETSLEVPRNIQNTLWLSYTPPGCLPEEFHILPQRYMCIHSCACSIHNSKEMQPAHLKVHPQMNGQWQHSANTQWHINQLGRKWNLFKERLLLPYIHG